MMRISHSPMALSKHNSIFFQITVLLFLASLGFPVQAQILLNVDWENGDYESYGFSTSGNPTTAIVSAPSPVCEGSHSAEFSLAFTDPVSFRTELTLNKGPMKEFKIGGEYWIGFRIFLPDDWAADTAQEVLFQLHGRPDLSLGEDWRNPPFAIRTDGDSWIASYLVDTKQITVDKNYTQSGRFNLGKFQTGSWTNFVIHTKWSPHSDGYIDIWKDGQLVAKKTNGIGYNDLEGPYLKMGIYKKVWDLTTSWGKATDVSSRTHYIDELRIGDAGSSYNEIEPKCGTTIDSGTVAPPPAPSPPAAPSGLIIQLN